MVSQPPEPRPVPAIPPSTVFQMNGAGCFAQIRFAKAAGRPCLSAGNLSGSYSLLGSIRGGRTAKLLRRLNDPRPHFARRHALLLAQ